MQIYGKNDWCEAAMAKLPFLR